YFSRAIRKTLVRPFRWSAHSPSAAAEKQQICSQLFLHVVGRAKTSGPSRPDASLSVEAIRRDRIGGAPSKSKYATLKLGSNALPSVLGRELKCVWADAFPRSALPRLRCKTLVETTREPGFRRIGWRFAGAVDDGAARAWPRSILLRVRSRQGGAGRSFGQADRRRAVCKSARVATGPNVKIPTSTRFIAS